MHANGPFASDNGSIRRRQRGTFLSFPGNLARCVKFPGKGCPIPPGRRHIGPVVPADAWCGTDRVRPVIYTRYAVGNQTEHLCPTKAGFAGGRMGRDRSCSHNICTLCKCCVNKNKIFHPAGGEAGPFIQMSTRFGIDRVTHVIYRSDAVLLIPVLCQTQTPDSPAAAWDSLYLYHDNFALCAKLS